MDEIEFPTKEIYCQIYLKSGNIIEGWFIGLEYTKNGAITSLEWQCLVPFNIIMLDTQQIEAIIQTEVRNVVSK